MNNIQSIGLKVGSMNTAFAFRNGNGIETRTTKTFIKYRKDLKGSDLPPIVGDEAANFAGAVAPLNLGVIENEDGISQTKLILEFLDIPKDVNVLIAAPAIEITEGKNRLARAVKEVCQPYGNKVHVFSECLCSAAYILRDPNLIMTSTFLCINLGSSTTEIGCFNEGQIEHLSAHSETSGNRVDKAIRNRIQNTVGDAMLLEKDIRIMKEQASLTYPKIFKAPGFSRNGYIEVRVQDEIIIPIQEYAEGVANIIKTEIIGSIEPHIRKLMLENQVIISGGMANIEGLPEMVVSKLSEKLNYPIRFKTSENDNHIAPAIGGLLLCEEIVKE